MTTYRTPTQWWNNLRSLLAIRPAPACKWRTWTMMPGTDIDARYDTRHCFESPEIQKRMRPASTPVPYSFAAPAFYRRVHRFAIVAPNAISVNIDRTHCMPSMPMWCEPFCCAMSYSRKMAFDCCVYFCLSLCAVDSSNGVWHAVADDTAMPSDKIGPEKRSGRLLMLCTAFHVWNDANRELSRSTPKRIVLNHFVYLHPNKSIDFLK